MGMQKNVSIRFDVDTLDELNSAEVRDYVFGLKEMRYAHRTQGTLIRYAIQVGLDELKKRTRVAGDQEPKLMGSSPVVTGDE